MASPTISDRRPIVISGPSGVGKGTLYQKLLDTYPTIFATTVSHTTRQPRPGEVQGRAYYFGSRQKFESLVVDNAFVEHAEFNGDLYGTSRQTAADRIAEGFVPVLDIEMEGVKQLKENCYINPRFIFIKPPSLVVLEERLRGRGTEEESSIQKRLTQARAELEYAETGVHDKVIVNDDLEVAFRELEAFVFAKT